MARTPDDSQLSFLPQSNQNQNLRYQSLEPQLVLSVERLQQWKQAVRDFQQQVRHHPASQGTLLELSSNQVDLIVLAPFIFQRYSFRFHTWPTSRNANDPVIYFVFDDAVPILLYIGQAVKAHQRWAGVHDCKTYVDNYINANYRHQQKTAVCTAFWWDTPTALTPRLQLEARLIAKWQSPFNKENRESWATPFTHLN